MGAAESKLPTSEPPPDLDFEGMDYYAILGISSGFSEDELKVRSVIDFTRFISRSHLARILYLLASI